MDLNARHSLPALILLTGIGLAGCYHADDQTTRGLDAGGDGSGADEADGADDGAAASTIAACQEYCPFDPDGCPDCAHLSPVMSACIRNCVVQQQECPPDFPQVNCIGYRCARWQGVSSLDTVPLTCQEAWIAYFDCVVSQEVLCQPDTGRLLNEPGTCAAEAEALVAMCQ